MRPEGVPLAKEFKFLFNRLPFYLIFYPTSRCNARCRHCFNHIRQDNTGAGKELTLEEIDKISGNLEHIKILTITGGEPFLRNDLQEIVSIFHKNNGAQYISFHTNAFLTEEIIRTISMILEKLAGIQVIVCISIDGIGQIHDDSRGLKGGFKKMLETISGLKALKQKHKNLSLVTNTVLSRTTKSTFLDTMRFIEDNMPGVKPTLSLIRGSARDEEEKTIDCNAYEDFYRNFRTAADKNINPFSPAAVKESIEIFTNKIVAKNYKSRLRAVPCQSGRKLVVIYENGDVYPCEMLDNKLGNLRDVGYDIKQLLFSPKARAAMDKINQNGSCCCTWENIIPVNLLFSPSYYPRIFYEWLRSFIFKR